LNTTSRFTTVGTEGENVDFFTSGFLWPNGRVPYVISDDFNDTHKAVIQSAVESYNSEFTDCISWVPRHVPLIHQPPSTVTMLTYVLHYPEEAISIITAAGEAFRPVFMRAVKSRGVVPETLNLHLGQRSRSTF